MVKVLHLHLDPGSSPGMFTRPILRNPGSFPGIMCFLLEPGTFLFLMSIHKLRPAPQRKHFPERGNGNTGVQFPNIVNQLHNRFRFSLYFFQQTVVHQNIHMRQKPDILHHDLGGIPSVRIFAGQEKGLAAKSCKGRLRLRDGFHLLFYLWPFYILHLFRHGKHAKQMGKTVQIGFNQASVISRIINGNVRHHKHQKYEKSHQRIQREKHSQIQQDQCQHEYMDPCFHLRRTV